MTSKRTCVPNSFDEPTVPHSAQISHNLQDDTRSIRAVFRKNRLAPASAKKSECAVGWSGGESPAAVTRLLESQAWSQEGVGGEETS